MAPSTLSSVRTILTRTWNPVERREKKRTQLIAVHKFRGVAARVVFPRVKCLPTHDVHPSRLVSRKIGGLVQVGHKSCPLRRLQGVRAASRQVQTLVSRNPCVTSLHTTAADDGGLVQKSPVAGEWLAFLDAFYRFTRPHTIYGTTISVISISMLAVQSMQDIHVAMFTGLIQALVPALLMNISIVGLNQLCDVEIDKVNKPYLPLASGEFTPTTGKIIVVSTAVVSLLMGLVSGSAPLVVTIAASLVLGILYSAELPFLRWKRYPFLAAVCIFIVRAVLVQLGFFLHMRVSVLGAPAALSSPLIFATGFMCLCSVVIALFKDIPDVAGDSKANVRTLSVRLGVERVFNICRGLMAVAYAGAVIAGLCSENLVSCILTGLLHTILANAMWSTSQKVDLTSSASLYGFYMYIWKVRPFCFQ
mmetsp:Transcript_33170/g.62438  ORF Transcript_33170/g.62438 Transcript_33170/m.62438 type:complete len:420 (-) Transcript_33170:706-1965(-)